MHVRARLMAMKVVALLFFAQGPCGEYGTEIGHQTVHLFQGYITCTLSMKHGAITPINLEVNPVELVRSKKKFTMSM